MTEKQAIEVLNGNVPDINNVVIARAVAIKALEKQIPAKPFLWGDGYSDGHLVYDTWDCPSCGKSYELDIDEYDFCPNCGQRIDWEEEHE